MALIWYVEWAMPPAPMAFIRIIPYWKRPRENWLKEGNIELLRFSPRLPTTTVVSPLIGPSPEGDTHTHMARKEHKRREKTRREQNALLINTLLHLLMRAHQPLLGPWPGSTHTQTQYIPLPFLYPLMLSIDGRRPLFRPSNGRWGGPFILFFNRTLWNHWLPPRPCIHSSPDTFHSYSLCQFFHCIWSQPNNRRCIHYKKLLTIIKSNIWNRIFTSLSPMESE